MSEGVEEHLCLRYLEEVPTRFPTAIAASESVLFVGCRNGTTLCIGTDSQRLLSLRPCPRPTLRRDEEVVCLAVHPCRRTVVAIASLSGAVELVCTKRSVSNTLQRWQTNSGRISALQFDDSGERLFVGHESGALCFFDIDLKSSWGHLKKGFDVISTFLASSTKTLHSFASAIHQLQFSAGRLLVCTQRHVFVFSTSNGQCIQIGRQPHHGAFGAWWAGSDGDSSFGVCSRPARRLWLFDTRTGKVEKTMQLCRNSGSFGLLRSFGDLLLSYRNPFFSIIDPFMQELVESRPLSVFDVAIADSRNCFLLLRRNDSEQFRIAVLQSGSSPLSRPWAGVKPLGIEQTFPRLKMSSPNPARPKCPISQRRYLL